MNLSFANCTQQLQKEPQSWLITGVAGFIGSNLLETLLKLDQKVVGLDNFATGHQHNLDEVQHTVSTSQWENFRFIEGDIRDPKTCTQAAEGADYILHQAALGSVPRSITDPLTTNATNITGFLNMLNAARLAEIKTFVYAASSSTYGDHPDLPKVEDKIGNPLSPYAVTKLVNELYSDAFSRVYGYRSIGLRYFNIFGKRQDPEGAYAAVIPKWVAALIHQEDVFINGDGETSRDFCFIDNAVQANILAALSNDKAKGEVYNVAVGDQTSLNTLFFKIRDLLAKTHPEIADAEPKYREFRAGDVRHSLADISKAKELLGYTPSHRIDEGLETALQWYVNSLNKNAG